VITLSLTGIAGASAANVGTAQTHIGNSHIVQKNMKIHVKHLKIVNKSTKMQKRVVKKLKTVKKTNSSKNTTTQNVNIKSSATSSNKYKVYKHYKYTSNSKYFYAAGSKKVIRNSYRSANTSSINTLASSLTSGVSSQYQKGTNVFNWVRDHISYSFYSGTRYGASGTLTYRKGNCADQAHLVVSLARSSGLPARYVHAKAHFTSGHVYGHVWAQICANGKWYIADPTSNRNSFGVARNWNSARIEGISNEISF
jgi:transglutaminase-like putative cysteine protease